MSLFDAFDLIDLFDPSAWRFFVPLLVGIGAGLFVYFTSDETPASAAVAFALGLAGFIVGWIWEFSHGQRR